MGGENLDRSFQAAAVNGTVVTIVSRSTHNLEPLHSKGLSLHVVFMLLTLMTKRNRNRHGEILQEISRLADEGKVRPLLDPRVFTFAEATEAHRYFEAGKHLGKITLVNERF